MITEQKKINFQTLPKVIRQCFACHRKKSKSNPLAKCHECKEWFCFNHIYTNQAKEETEGTNEPLRDVCLDCKQKFNYKLYGET